jgi:hypothetical protein
LTFDEKPDVDWWNSILVKDKSHGGCCGLPLHKTLSGWIMHFFGIYKESTI